MFLASSMYRAEKLCHMFMSEVFNGLEFDNEFIFDREVHFECAEVKVVFVKDIKRALLLDSDTLFCESMSESVFIKFLFQSMFQKSTEAQTQSPSLCRTVGRFADSSFLWLLSIFVAGKNDYLSHSPITKSKDPRMAGMSETMWPGRSWSRRERLMKDGLRILRR